MISSKKRSPLNREDTGSCAISNLYRAFREQLFCSGKEMDTAFLTEILYAMDERPDEDAAPHKEVVWQRISSRIREQGRSVNFRMTRKAVVVLVIIMILLLTSVSYSVIDWAGFFQNIYHTNQEEIPVSNWPLSTKEELISCLKVAGYPVPELPVTEGKKEEEKDRILTEWIRNHTNGEVNDWLYNILTQLKGNYYDWNLEDRAWFSSLLLENGSVHSGDFVCTCPSRLDQSELEILVQCARDKAEELYRDTAVETETWTPYLFYGYVYPAVDQTCWQIRFRDEARSNWLTVQFDGRRPLESEMTIVSYPAPPEDVG